MRGLLLCACLAVPALGACRQQDEAVPPAPPEVAVDLEKVLYQVDPPGGPAGEGFAALIGIVREGSLDAFLRDHATKDRAWSNGPFRIDEVGIGGDDYIGFLEGWIEANNVELDIIKLVKWRQILKSDDPARFYRIWYRHRNTGSTDSPNWQIESARLWLLDTRTRIFVYFLQNT